MRHPIAQHERIDVFCALTGFQSSAEMGDQQAQCLRLSIRQVCQTWSVVLRFNHQVTQIGSRLSFTNLSMPCVDQIIFVDRSTRYQDFPSMLAADKAICWLLFERAHVFNSSDDCSAV